MSRLAMFILKRICRKLVVQGHEHRANVIRYFRIMRDAAEAEFNEDNEPTLNAFMKECFDEANRKGTGRACMKCGDEIAANTSEIYDPAAVNPRHAEPGQPFYFELCPKCSKALGRDVPAAGNLCQMKWRQKMCLLAGFSDHNSDCFGVVFPTFDEEEAAFSWYVIRDVDAGEIVASGVDPTMEAARDNCEKRLLET